MLNRFPKALFLMLMLLTGIVGDCLAQLQQAGTPFSFDRDVRTTPPFISLEAEPVHETEIGDKLPPVAGHLLPFDSDADSSGEWTRLADGSVIWRLGIEMENAAALNVYLGDLNLSDEDRLYVYSADRTVTLGAFTSQNNSLLFPTRFIYTDRVVIEYNSSSGLQELPFRAVEVGYSLVGEPDTHKDFGDGGFCEVKVNCPEGESWQDEKQGVARILVRVNKTLFWCSGALVNNTSLDQTPYLLTAKHCGEDATQIDYLGWMFFFNYESKDCDYPPDEPAEQTLEGAALLASSLNSSNSGSDFKLLLLKHDVPHEYLPYYNGWDRTGEGSPEGVTIHHPEGDIKMISTYTDPLLSTNYNNPNFDPNGKYWKVTWSETESGHGVTEGGSSGAPLFSEEGLIVGLLSGGRASCSGLDLPDYYGKFSYSWLSNGSDSSRQLRPWLDPINSGEQKLPGMNADTGDILVFFTATTTQVRVGGSVDFINQSEGDISGFEWHFPGGNPSSSEMETPPTITYSSTGNYDVMLIARTASGNDTLLRKDYITVLPTISPNPSNGKYRINFGKAIPDDLEITVTDLTGRPVNFFLTATEKNTATVDLSQQQSGTYLIRIKNAGTVKMLKVILVRKNTLN